MKENADTTEYKMYCMLIYGQTTVDIMKGPRARPSGIFKVLNCYVSFLSLTNPFNEFIRHWLGEVFFNPLCQSVF